MSTETSNLLDRAFEHLKKAFDSKHKEEEVEKSLTIDKTEIEKNEEREKEIQKSIVAEREKLTNLVKSFSTEANDRFETIQKSMEQLSDQNQALNKSVAATMEVIKALNEQVVELKRENSTLSKSLEDLLNRPLGRKSVVSQREVQTIQKSVTDLSRTRVDEVLLKAFENGEIDDRTILKYNAGNTPLHRLDLPESVKHKLGI